MKTNRYARLPLAAGVSALALAAPAFLAGTARAQTVDYGALEQVFGEPVTTSATGKPQKASDAPVTMEIITQDDIRRSGADNIPDILQFVSGISVRRYGFASADVGIRGYDRASNPSLLVLVNGRQVYFDDYGYVDWATIPVQLDEIRQIEVVKGPNSALFGFNAASGVINIVTYDPLNDNANSLSAQTGTQNLAEGSAVATVHLSNNAGVRVSVGGFTAHEFDHPGYTGADNPESGAISADGKVRLGPAVELGFSASESDTQTFANSPISVLSNQAWRTNSEGARLAATTPYGLINLNVYHNLMAFNDIGAVYWTNNIYVVQANDLLKISPDHTIRLGVEYRNNSIASPDSGLIGGAVGYQVWSGSGMWSWDITPKVSLTNAVRLDYLSLSKSGLPGNGFFLSDYNNRSLTAVSFNSGLVYKPTDDDTLRATASRGVQAPSLVLLGDVDTGNPNLSPQIVSNYEFAYDRTLEALKSVARASVFYQRQENVLGAVFGEAPMLTPSGRLVSIANNIGSSHEIGLELGFKGHTDSGFRWNASYSYASVTDHLIGEDAFPLLSNVDYEHGTPEHTVTFGGGYSIQKWEFDVEGRWQSSWTDFKTLSPFLPLTAVRVPNYVSMNLRVGYKITDTLTASVTAEQFNQARILTSAGLPTERRVLFKLKKSF
jgi:iron complex outermembrane receptor protein